MFSVAHVDGVGVAAVSDRDRMDHLAGDGKVDRLAHPRVLERVLRQRRAVVAVELGRCESANATRTRSMIDLLRTTAGLRESLPGVRCLDREKWSVVTWQTHIFTAGNVQGSNRKTFGQRALFPMITLRPAESRHK